MAKTMRKNNLKIQMLAGNSLNSFLISKSEENSTLVLNQVLPQLFFFLFSYRKCPHSRGYCIRREFFCDGRVNCAWPDAEAGGTDEVLCDVEGMYSSDRL